MPALPPPVNVSPLIKFFRYSLLIAGIFYGAGKRQALKALEASRADDKARKRAERDKKLAEEKRLAAERDFNQIVEIFSPPPRVEDLGDTKVVNQDFNPSTQGLNTEPCDSLYEPIYKNDTEPDYSLTLPIIIEPDVSKADEIPSESKFYDQPLDFSVDDFTKSYLKRADDVDGDNKNSDEKGSCGVLCPNDLNDSGYIITDFDASPILPSNDEGHDSSDN